MWMPQTPAAEPDMLDGTPGSINVSSILTGKLVAKISAVAKPRTCRERRTADALTGVGTRTLLPGPSNVVTMSHALLFQATVAGELHWAVITQ